MTDTDIANMDKVIAGLNTSRLDTVPELLNGYQKFPQNGSPETSTYKHYENILIENKICSIKDDWEPNLVFNGFRALELNSGGFEIIHNNKSIRQYLKEQEEKNRPPSTSVLNITGNGNSGIVQGSSLRDFTNTHNTTTPIPAAKDYKQNAGTSFMGTWIAPIITAIVSAIIIGLATYYFPEIAKLLKGN